MLGMGSFLSVPAAKAEQSESQNLQSSIKQAQNELSALKSQKAEIEAKIKSIEAAIAENEAKIAETDAKITETQAEIESLKAEIAVIQERIDKRNEILKARAVSFQENGGQVNYLDVILGSQSFGDFIGRVDAVMSFIEADSAILKEHEADKQALVDKQEAVNNKLTELNATKMELEGMRQQIEEQKAQSEELKQKLIQQENASESELQALQREDEQRKAAQFAALQAASASVQTESNKVSTKLSSTPSASTSAPVSGSLSAVISAGYKYIGNSTYKFGGGRTSYDISHGYFDCSGFVSWAFRQGGYSVGASTDVLKGTGTRVSFSEIKPGDMVFFNTYKTDGHVGIYIGGGKFIGSQSSTGVAIADMSSGYWADTFNGRVMRVAN